MNPSGVFLSEFVLFFVDNRGAYSYNMGRVWVKTRGEDKRRREKSRHGTYDSVRVIFPEKKDAVGKIISV